MSAADLPACDLAITNGRILDLGVPGNETTGHVVIVTGDTIVEVASDALDRWSPRRTIDAAEGVVMPGMVDAHVHLSAFLAAAMPYTENVDEGMFSGGSKVEQIVPFIAQMTSMTLPAELTATVLRPAFAAMVKSGITSVVDAGSSGHDGIVQAARDVGNRAAVGPSLADSWHDASGNVVRQTDAAELLETARRWLETNRGEPDDLVRGLISAVETIACSDELLTGIAELADELDLPTHIHSHITPASDAAHLAVYGETATKRLFKAGLLTPRLTAMHVGNATDSDIEAFADAGITVNHNPLGNAMLGFATVEQRAIPRMLEAGIPVVLGSDYAPSMMPTPFESIRAALTVHREAGGSDVALTAETALKMATNPGVPIGQPGRLGRIAAGQLADIVIIDTSGPHHIGDRHPVPAVALRAQPGDVAHVVIGGQIVVDGGSVATIDEETATAAANQLLASLR